MLGCRFMGQIPFKHVPARHGSRWSRAEDVQDQGNVVDPLSVVDKHARMPCGLRWLPTAGRSISFWTSVWRVTATSRRAVWNASRFALMNFDDYDASATDHTLSPLISGFSPSFRWRLID